MIDVNRSNTYSSLSSVGPAPACTEPSRGSIKRVLIAAGLATAVAGNAWAAQPPEGAVNDSAGNSAMVQSPDGSADPESAARSQWRTFMAQNGAPDKGCFHSTYPSFVWEKVDCAVAQPRVHPEHIKPADDKAAVTGAGNDYVAYATGLIQVATGAFAINGVKSEKTVNVPFGGGESKGILGTNEYSVQLNTNDKETTGACSGHSDCTVWQQFVYATDYIRPGVAGVFMQYWLINWGSSSCPKGGWIFSKPDECYLNSPVAPATDVPITALGQIQLQGTAQFGALDTVTFFYDGEGTSTSNPDAILEIGGVWNKAEFNVLGDIGGSRADFNSGSSINVYLSLYDGSAAKPTCLANAGTTGETNNLSLGSCTASEITIAGVPIAQIQFIESN
jgi:hypothetical protein